MANPLQELISHLEEEVLDPEEGTLSLLSFSAAHNPILYNRILSPFANISHPYLRDISPLLQRHSVSRPRLHRFSRRGPGSPARWERRHNPSISRRVGIKSQRRYDRSRSVLFTPSITLPVSRKMQTPHAWCNNVTLTQWQRNSPLENHPPLCRMARFPFKPPLPHDSHPLMLHY